MAISGSLYSKSTNTGLLDECKKLNSKDIEWLNGDIANLPLFNEDLIVDGKFPAPVEALRQQLIASNAILFAIPENNFRISAPLKNAYDWMSVMKNGDVAYLAGKPLGMISAAVQGGNKAQEHMKQVTAYCKVRVMNSPTINVQRFVPGNFDENGKVASPKITEDIRNFLGSFINFINPP